MLQLAVTAGLGRRGPSPLSPSRESTILRLQFIFQLLHVASITFGKLAVVSFFLVVRGLRAARPWLLVGLAGCVVVFNVADEGTMLAQCRPLRLVWTATTAMAGTGSSSGGGDAAGQTTGTPVAAAGCRGRRVNMDYSYFQGAANALADAVLAAYPVHLLWGVRMARRVKIGVCALMGVGWMYVSFPSFLSFRWKLTTNSAAACAAIKTYQLHDLTDTRYPTAGLAPLLLWASIESWIIVSVTCVPSLRPLVLAALARIGLVDVLDGCTGSCGDLTVLSAHPPPPPSSSAHCCWPRSCSRFCPHSYSHSHTHSLPCSYRHPPHPRPCSSCLAGAPLPHSPPRAWDCRAKSPQHELEEILALPESDGEGDGDLVLDVCESAPECVAASAAGDGCGNGGDGGTYKTDGIA